MQVRQKAQKVLSGLVHSSFLSESAQLRLIQTFRARTRRKMKRKNSTPGTARFRRDDIGADKQKLVERHSGVLGLCAFVVANPYAVPHYVPEILVELERHLHDPQPVPK